MVTTVLDSTSVFSQEQKKKIYHDSREFAPMAASEGRKKEAISQLSDFPLPRLRHDDKVLPNFPWFNIKYLHRSYQEGSGKGAPMNADAARKLMEELTVNWNYYIEVPCLRTDSLTAERIYNDPNSIEYAMIKYANEHPEIPTSTITFHLQNNGQHLGYIRRNFIKSQDLDNKYYLCDATGKPIVYKGKKWLSPLMPLDIVEKDAAVTRMYLRQLLKHLKRPLNFINENGEVYGHMRPEELLKSDHKVAADMAKKNVNNSVYNGLFQNRLDSCYKAQILSEPGLKNTLFSYYNVSSVQSGYWPDYFARKNTNSKIDNRYYSTPSFYVTSATSWSTGRGPSNGYGQIADGREREISAGVKTFSPFVSAGWGKEVNNLRPAQWLALLKAMTVLGADFFYTGYFNVTDKQGWANGKGPNDPWEYTYQIAMPVYAQAIGQQFQKFVSEGELLKTNNLKRMSMYRMITKDPNHLVLVRKLGTKYLIYGSVQPDTKGSDQYPVVATTKIEIEGRHIHFNIRRQGSVYILDITRPDAPVMTQLDGWHEDSHPSYWSKNSICESENGLEFQNCTVITEGKAVKGLDFTDFLTFIHLGNNGSFAIEYPGRKSNRGTANIRVRNTGNLKSSVILQGPNGDRISKAVSEKNWTTIGLSREEVERLRLKQGSKLIIGSVGNGVDIDWIQF
ncbi:hypothetical protein [Flavihumibacter solisilvae]|uniref:hypothetical protein n=1 Tax=Flavihumibacter solisilvae TaxID=1349421 RepID=UPI0012698DB9|nr:hypothetical protein [Flavihumibacter solisilvae]